MTETFLVAILLLNAATLAAVIALFLRKKNESSDELKAAVSAVSTQIAALDKSLYDLRRSLGDEFARSREEQNASASRLREEIAKEVKNFSDTLFARMAEHERHQKTLLEAFSAKLSDMTALLDKRMQEVRHTVETQLKNMAEENAKKLDQMRETVDEKLHKTLEERLSRSFKDVSERLELVHKGLGEMQSLASGVGDLKKVLTNVKTRGVWGEYQLGGIVEQILSRDQYETNFAPKKGSLERVEFAVKLPGKGGESDFVYLPIDSKFPIEDYQRLVAASEGMDKAALDAASAALAKSVEKQAKEIRDKYINPPRTTDFGVMFLPTESLYAEVLRIDGLYEKIRSTYKVAITGPSTAAAFLNSLEMGFRTLAVEKRSSEVWRLLGGVKKEFEKFGDLLDKTSKKLQETTNTIDDAVKRSRAIERKLKDVEALPGTEEKNLTLIHSDDDA